MPYSSLCQWLCCVQQDGMMTDLIDMFQRYGYHDASCFGHALEGNLHLVFAQVSIVQHQTMGSLGN